MKKKKLVYFNFVIHFGGARRSTITLCEQLRKYDEVVVLDCYGFCREYINALTEKNIPVHILLPGAKHLFIGHVNKPWKRFWFIFRQLPTLLKLRRKLIKKILEINPDVIWTSEAKALFFLTTSVQLLKYPVAMFARGWYRRCQVSAWKRWLIKHRADCVLAVSNATAKAMADWGIPRRKIRVVLNAIDYESVVEDSRKKALGELPGYDRDFGILVPGQLMRTKGQHTAIQAAALLEQQGYDFTMWIAGDVSIADKSKYAEYLKKLISENSLENSVFLLEWRPDLPALMRLADIVVFPTHTEGLPRVVLEAMILKRPVISTPVGGVVELIVDGETGLLGPVDDARALAENIEKLIRDKDLIDRITQNAYKQVTERFSVERYVESVKHAFDDVLEKKGKQ
jgi:glycosyltransferase involved in cell wall biosynthesis